jgi:biotin carboxyl carrier protein
MMRRYRLKVGEREFAIDVQEQTADRYAVSVGGEAYEVTLAEDANPSAVSIAPRPTVALPPSRPAVTAGGKGALTAPMPGVILEVKVKAGDAVERGQPVAVLDAMKMHNTIASPQTGVVAEVLVAAGQTVDHGELILKYRET